MADGSESPEATGLAKGLARLLGLRNVRIWWGPPDVDALQELRHTLTAADVGIVCLTADLAQVRPSLKAALEVVREAGLEVAWSGLARNGLKDLRRETPLIVVATDRVDDVRSALATGTASLLFDESAPAGLGLDRPARVCVASYEVVGPTKNGGIGTANTSLAELLALGGNEVTLLYTGWQSLDDTSRGRWTRHYKQRGVNFVDLDTETPLDVDTPQFNQARAYGLYRWLRERDEQAPWDVVHFPECQGHGYYTLLARRLGLAFPDCTLVVGVHSPTRWVYEANRWRLESAHRLADDFLERQCVELADVVVSPSAYLLGWMELQGWTLPARRFVQHYATSGAVAVNPGDDSVNEAPVAVVMPEGPGTQAARELGYRFDPGDPTAEPKSAATTPPGDGPSGGIEEIVFFGRLETRKGLEVFCEALDILARDREPPEFRVTFMGSETLVQGIPAGEYLRSRGRGWPWSWCVKTDRNQLEAVAYIREPRRLAVMPSPVDNSPNTVLEALGLGIPFITSRGGGIPELIHPLDMEETTFDPADPEAGPIDGVDPGRFPAVGGGSLAQAIRRATGGEALRPRFAVDPEMNQRVHVEWHERVAAAGAHGLAEGSDAGEQAHADSVSVCLGADGDPVDLERVWRSLERQDNDPRELVVALPEERRSRWVAGLGEHLQERGWRVVDGRPGELDAAAAAAATGVWLFLCEPFVVAQPTLLSSLVASARRSKAEIVTTAVNYAQSDRAISQRNVPLGGAPLVGLFYDCFGVGGLLIRRDTFEMLGGFAIDGPPGVRRRDLLCRAALAGVRSTVVPDPLLDYDREAAEKIALSPAETQWRTLRPYRHALPNGFAELPGIALSLSLVPPAATDTAPAEEYVRTLEGTLDVMRTSRSWRVTQPLREAMERLRRRR